jgi:hypothetical protein
MGLLSLEEANTVHFFETNQVFHEAWYYLIDLPEYDASVWFRHTLLRPKGHAAFAELWGIWFDSQQAPLVFREVFSLDFVRSSDKFFFIQTAKSWLRSQGALGYLSKEEQTLHWDLDFESHLPPHQLQPPWMQNLPVPGGQFCTPQPHLLCSGKIRLNGQTFLLDQEPGMQGHIWGHSQALRWVWVHCNTFLEDADTWLEGVAGHLAWGPMVLPAQTFFLTYRGKAFAFGPLQFKWRLHSSEPGICHWLAEKGDWRFDCVFQVKLQDLAQSDWATLNQRSKQWSCSKRGNAQLSVYRKQAGEWRLLEVMHAQETCSIEWVAP